MGRNLIQRPRFFIDFPQYWRARGVFPKSQYGYNDHISNSSDEPISGSLFGLDLNAQFETTGHIGEKYFEVRIWINGDSNTGSNYSDRDPIHAINEFEQINYCAVFGHNLKSQGLCFKPTSYKGQEGGANTAVPVTGLEEIFNCTVSPPAGENSDYAMPDYDGTSIFKFDGWSSSLYETDDSGAKVDAVKCLRLLCMKVDGTNFTGNEVISFSGVSFGRTFTMPRSPDLKTSVKYDYGINNKEGIDGSTFEQINWLEPKRLPTGYPSFYVKNNFNPNYDYTPANNLLTEDRDIITATGRRTWTMKFTALANSNLFPANPMETFYTNHVESNSITTGGYSSDHTEAQGAGNGEQYFKDNISTDTSFYSMVLNRTLGGSLPMIFQNFTDGNGYGDNNPGEFAIVKLGGRGLQFNANTFNTYNIGLTVRESW